MAAAGGAGKANDRNKRKATAGRLSYLMNGKFILQGFKSNAPIPSVAEARKMAADNARMIASQKPQPSVRG